MGAEVKRKEDPRLITGRSTYVTDVVLPGMHHVAFVRSPHAHARIRRIDASAATRRPGVFTVVTGEDIRTRCAPLPLEGASAEGSGPGGDNIGRKHYPLSVDRVRHVGEAVAAVVATSEAVAVDAAAEIVVDWEPLPAVTDPFAAMAGGAPQVHDDAPGNVEHKNAIKAGDSDGAFARARRVVTQRMVSQRLCGVPIEPRATVAALDPTTGGIVLWATTQAPHSLRNDLAAALGLPQNLVRVIAPEVGGGFGVKFGLYPEDATLATLARLYLMPLRWVETRLEHMMATTHGRAQAADLEAAVEDDGTITALRMRVTANIGAYAVFTFIPDLTLMMGIGVYKIPNIDLQSTCVFTNTTTVAAYRGAGRPEAAYYLERLIDIIALELGKPPEEVRRKNFIPPSAFPYAAPTGQKYDSGEYDRALTKALGLARYADLRREQRERIARADRRLLGVGMSCYVEMCGFGPFESAVVRAEPGGTVTAITGTSAHGQGHETTFAQIIADHLGVDFDKIVVRHGDTLNTPMGNGTGGSRSLAVGGSAILQAALRVQDKARRIAAHMLEAAPVDVAYVDGRYQVHGGLAQGIAQALLEELVYGDDGQLVTGTLMDYAVPHADDLPTFTTEATVTPTPHNPMGAKGIGEAATIGSTPAIVNAVVDALRRFGVRHVDMPLRPERVWLAMQRRAGA